MYGQRTILFVDEIHRFNKAQQDVILPHVEDGTITFIGATTENPSFEVNAPLLSRCRVFTLHPLSAGEVETIIHRALADEARGLGKLKLGLTDAAMQHLVNMANGDARVALNALEIAASAMTIPHSPPLPKGDTEGASSPGPEGSGHLQIPPTPLSQRGAKGDSGRSAGDAAGPHIIDLHTIADALQRRSLVYDRAGESHYDTISAFIKSVRGSSPDGALYWLARMIEAGEDPLFIARRLVILAAEDIGLAEPEALAVAVAAQQAVHFLGMPEGRIPLAEATVYLATAPKSNSAYMALERALEDVRQQPNEPVPLHLRNAGTGLMQGMGYGKGYHYAHDYPGHFVEQEYLPPSLKGRRYYQPAEEGREKLIAERLKRWWEQ
jgi:putative ATPase